MLSLYVQDRRGPASPRTAAVSCCASPSDQFWPLREAYRHRLSAEAVINYQLAV